MMDNNKMSKDTFYKVGIKILSDVQLENIFPNYHKLFDEIEIYRNAISNLSNEMVRKEQYNLMFDNIFSIMGKRGTGKTSVAFTLKKKIEEEQCNDIVLPIIIPEVIPEDCSILVWILAIVREKVQKLEQRINEIHRNDGREDKWSRCGWADYDSLAKQVEELMELVFAGKYDPSVESSYYKIVGNSIRQAGDYYRFSCEITKLWSKWVEKIKELRWLERHGDKNNVEPLIFFIFDDVDLEPQKVKELLSIIIKYLSHPNIIVITTADEEMFLEVIENNLDKDIGRLPKEWRNYLNNYKSDIFYEAAINEKHGSDLIAQTSRMYLGKVLPTSTRYYLRLFSHSIDKCRFRLDNRNTLIEAMNKQVSQLLKIVGSTMSDNFLNCDERVQKFYLNFFGDTSRQIGNAYLGWTGLVQSLEEIIKNIKKNQEREDISLGKIYTSCRYFLCIAIHANHEMAEKIEHIDEFVDEMFLMNYSGWSLYVNYIFLNDFLEDLFEEGGDKKGNIRIAFELYSLFMFLENVLLIVEEAIDNKMITRKRIHGIASMNNFITEKIFEGRALLRRGMGAGEFLEHYADLIDDLSSGALKSDCSSPYFFKEYLYSFVDVDYNANKIIWPDLNRWMNENSRWLEEITGILATVYGNIYLIEKEEIENCQIYKGEKFLTIHQKLAIDFLYKNIENEVCKFQMLNNAMVLLEEIENDISVKEKNFVGQTEFLQICAEVRKKWEDENTEIEKKETEIFVLLEYVLDLVIQTCEEKKLIELLCVTSEIFNNNLNKKICEALSGHKSVAEELQNMKHRIERQDYYIKYVSVPDVTEWIKKLREIFVGNQKGNDLLDDILAKSVDKEDKDIIEASCFTELKKLLEEMLNRTEYRREGVRENLITSINDVVMGVDAVVDLNDENEFNKAVELGLGILALSKLEIIYLAQSVTNKYQNAYRFSSVGVEKRGEGENTYYYQMYLKIADLINSRQEPASEALKMFLIRAAEGEMKKYLRMLK